MASSARRGSVLIVEDDEGLRYALAKDIERLGLVAVTVPSGEAALARAGEVFDVALVDLRLPGMNGIELLRRWKQSAPDTEMILLTGKPELETSVQALRHGAFDYLSKPVEWHHLAERLEQAFERRRRRSAAAFVEVARVVLAVDDPSSLPRRITTLLRSQLGADDVTLMVADPDGTLRILHADGLPAEVIRDTRVLPGERIAGKVALGKTPVLLQGDAADDPRFCGVEAMGTARSSILYPIVAGETLLALLTVNRRAPDSIPYGPEDVEHVGVLAATVRLALENARLVRRQGAIEPLAVMGELVAGIAHELSTPLAYLQANLSYVKRGLATVAAAGEKVIAPPALQEQWRNLGGPEGVVELTQAVEDSSDAVLRIRELVGDLKTLSRPDSRRLEETDLNAAIRSALRLAGSELKAYRVEVDLGEDLVTVGDGGRLTQVFINLLVNAAHALAQVSADRRRIFVRSFLDRDRVVAEIRDEGCGVPPAIRGRIFEPFFTTKGDGQGTGLGLSISKGIVSRHGGHLSLHASSDRGTTFRVELPARAAQR